MNTDQAKMRQFGEKIILLLVAAIHLGVVWSVMFDRRPVIWPLHNDTIHRVGRGADFYAVYHAALSVQMGRAPYSQHPDGVTPYWYPFRYLPVVAVLFQPFTWFEPVTAYRIWVVVVELTLLGLALTLWRRFAPGYRRLFAISALLLSSPHFLELYMGQFTFVTIALCYLSLLLPWGQILFSLSAVIKMFTLVVSPALVRQSRYWPHILLAIAMIGITAVPHFLNYPGQLEFFLRVNFRPEGGMHAGNYGLLRWVFLALQDSGTEFTADEWSLWTGAFRWIVLAFTAITVLLSRRNSVLFGASALLLAHFVTYQHVWEHHLSGVIVAGVVLLLDRNLNRATQWLVILALIMLVVPTLFGVFDAAKDPGVSDPSLSWPRWMLHLLVLPKVAPTVVLYALATGSLLRAGLELPAQRLASAMGQLNRFR